MKQLFKHYVLQELDPYDIIIRDLKYAYDWKMAIDIGSVAQTLNDQIFVLLHN